MSFHNKNNLMHKYFDSLAQDLTQYISQSNDNLAHSYFDSLTIDLRQSYATNFAIYFDKLTQDLGQV